MQENINEYALIVAGGSGSRMKSSIPKQFVEIGGLPVLMHTISAFILYSNNISIILVLPENQINRWDQLCALHNFSVPHLIVAGGACRTDSVINGLKHIVKEGIVAIHDGVRPFVGKEIIKAGFEAAKIHGNAVAAVPLKDSIRQVKGGHSTAVERSEFILVQTPQTFMVSQIKQAYEKYNESFTDDATVAENAGHHIHLIKGGYENIKITTPEDLIYAEAILKTPSFGRWQGL